MKFWIYGTDTHEILVRGDIERRYRIDMSFYKPSEYYLGTLELAHGIRPGLLVHCLFDGEWSFATSSGSLQKLADNIRTYRARYRDSDVSETLYIECPKKHVVFGKASGLIEMVHDGT